MKRAFGWLPIVAVVFSGALVTGCNTTPVQDGVVAGGLLGAGAGAIIGHQSGNQGEGALIGAAAGALAGALIGDQVDEQRTYGNQRTYSQPAPASSSRPTASGGHWETRRVTTQSGETYEERVWVEYR